MTTLKLKRKVQYAIPGFPAFTEVLLVNQLVDDSTVVYIRDCPDLVS